MASVDDLKGVLEDAVPGRAPRRRRLPVALVVAAAAGLVALASRLQPVRGAVGSAASGVRARVTSIRGSGGASPAPDMSASDLAAAEPATEATAPSDSGAASPVGIGFDDGAPSPASPETIPADTEEGRPAGV
jgi:hypothetical protein